MTFLHLAGRYRLRGRPQWYLLRYWFKRRLKRWLGASTAASWRFDAMTLLCFFLLGALAPLLIPLSLPWFLNLLLLPIALGLIVLLVRRRQLALVFGAVLGLMLTVTQVTQVNEARRWEPEELVREPVQIDRCWSADWGNRCLVRHRDRAEAWYLNWTNVPAPEPGRHGWADVTLQPWSATAVPGESSFAFWLLRHRISARGQLEQFEPVSRSRWHDLVMNVREWLRHRNLSPLGQSVYQALVLGDRSAMSEDLRGKVTRTQTQHLLALSGLHIGSLALWAYAIAGFIWRGYPTGARQSWQKGAAILVAGALLVIALPAVSLWRAFLMTLVPALAWCLRRRLGAHQILVMIAAMMVIADPLIWLDLGAWFSWWATLVLVMLVRVIGRRPGWQQLVVIQLVLSGLLIPVYALWSLPVFPLGMVLNLLLIPLVTFVALPAAFLTALQLPGAGWVFERSVWLWDWLLGAFDRFWVVFPVLSPLQAVLLILLCGALLLLRAGLKSWALLALITGSALWHNTQPQSMAEGVFDLWVLDAGNAQSIVIDTAEGRVLFDTGWGDGRSVHLGQPALRWHWQSPRRHWHAVITAHDGRDHAGGLASVAAAFTPQYFYTSEPPAGYPDTWPAPEFCDHNTGFQLSGVQFEFLRAAPGYRPEPGAAGSCVLKITGAGHSALIMGDLPQREEYRLLSNRTPNIDPELAAEVLVSASNGGNQSSSKALLAAVEPDIVVHGAETNHRFQRPDPAVLARVEALGARNDCTCQSHTLRYQFRSEGIIRDTYGNRLLPWLKINAQ